MNDINFPFVLDPLIKLIEDQDFFLTLVGGASRQFILKNEFPKDLDFELRHILSLSEEPFKEKIHSLKTLLEDQFSLIIDLLPFSILKFQWGDYQIELSPPRIEVFAKQEHYGHKDFKAELHSQLNYAEAFARRDFTVNAIGIEKRPGKSPILVDPLQGQVDLRQKILRPCGPNFSKDPVRFLRAIRFFLTMNLGPSEEIKKELPLFNLQSLGPHYFFYEAFKSGDFFLFCQIFFQWVEDHSIPLAHDLKQLSFLGKISSPIQVFRIEEILWILIGHLLNHQLENQEVHFFLEFAHFGQKNYLQYKKFLEGILYFDLERRIQLQTWIHDDRSFEFFLGQEDFHKLFQLYKFFRRSFFSQEGRGEKFLMILQKQSSCFSSFSWFPGWIRSLMGEEGKLPVIESDLTKISPKLRGIYQFFSLLKAERANLKLGV